jgi:glycerol dehydrogenase-like iron-containing ADH family enzyme
LLAQAESTMQLTAVFPGRYVQAEGALAQLGNEVARLGGNALLIANQRRLGDLHHGGHLLAIPVPAPQLDGTHGFYHGEKVAIGVLAGLFLADRPKATIDEVYRFCEAVELPTTLAQVGLANVTDDDLRIVAARACIEGETIHHEPCRVTPQDVLAALTTADEYGRQRRG